MSFKDNFDSDFEDFEGNEIGVPNGSTSNNGMRMPNSGTPSNGMRMPSGGMPGNGLGTPNSGTPNNGMGTPNRGMPNNGMRMPNGGMPNSGTPNNGMRMSNSGTPNNGMRMPNGMVNQTPNPGMPNNGMGVPNNGMGNQPPTNGNQQQRRRKKSKLPIILLLLIVLGVGGAVAYKFLSKPKEKVVEAQKQSYEKSGKYALDTLKEALNTYDPEAIDGVVGLEDGDSYLGQEWAYVNHVKLREEFLTKVGALVQFEYPTVPQLSTAGEVMVNADGSQILIESYMNNGEAFKATVPDYAQISAMMDTDVEYIQRLFKTSGYTEKDYTWKDDIVNLMLQYICDKEEIPTKQVEVTLPIRLNTKGTAYIEDDGVLDDILFGSDEMHNMCAKFSQICLNWTGTKDEHYTEQEEQHNPEYDDWYKLFTKYYNADKGKFNKYTSKWEPWYLRDDKDNFIRDKKGRKIVNYYSVKDKNGNDWIQPAETIMVDVDKVRQVPDPWVEETGVGYTWVGQNFIQNKYDGDGDTTVRVGDGSIEHPAGIGTTIITKLLGVDGKYHDIKVALMGYWTEQNAIDYAEKFSTKNRGFTTASVVQLICFEIKIENLEDKAFTFEGSEITLADSNTNISPRTGTLYGFTEETTILPGEEVIINDWAASTELAQKYVCWGRSFGRTYSMVFFDALAGTGNIPTYSAYTEFMGKSFIDDSIDTGANTTTPTPAPTSTSEGLTEEDVMSGALDDTIGVD